MPQTIDVSGLSPAAVQAVESLVTVLRSQQAAGNGSATLPPAVERLLDTDFHAECEADTSPEVTLADVRAGLATIPGDLTADFAAERDER
ncbi:hypothetical protein J0H58_16645 [bacterium]|mgnify:CR=1 FL=1|nr:hypothetical protein [bacterium]